MQIVQDRSLSLLFPTVTDLVDLYLEDPSDLQTLQHLAKILLTLHNLEKSGLLTDEFSSIIKAIT